MPSVKDKQIPIESSLGTHILYKRDYDVLVYLAGFPEGLTRAQLVKHFKLKRSTMYDALVRLEGEHLILRIPEPRNIRGRPRQYWKVNTDVR